MIGRIALAITLAAAVLLSSIQWWVRPSATLTALNTVKGIGVLPWDLAILAAALAFLFHPRSRRLASRAWLGWVLVGLLAVVTYLAHPLFINNLMSDRAAAMKIAINNLLAHGHPYATFSVFGSPISPGPGWIALNLPFGSDGRYFAMAPAWAGLLLIVLRRATGGWEAGTAAVAFCLATPAFLENAWQADLAALGLAMAAATVLAWNAVAAGGARMILLAGVFAGMVATGRIAFVVFPLLLGVVTFRQDGRRAAALATVGTGVAIGMHALAAVTGPPGPYQPLHLTSGLAEGPGLGAVAGLVALALVGAGALTWGGRSRASAIAWSGVAVFSAMLLVSWSKTTLAGWENWTGSIYLVPALPSLAAALGMLALEKPRPRA